MLWVVTYTPQKEKIFFVLFQGVQRRKPAKGGYKYYNNARAPHIDWNLSPPPPSQQQCHFRGEGNSRQHCVEHTERASKTSHHKPDPKPRTFCSYHRRRTQSLDPNMFYALNKGYPLKNTYLYFALVLCIWICEIRKIINVFEKYLWINTSTNSLAEGLKL